MMINAVDTFSVCPICLKRIRAQRVLEDGKVYMKKSCELHGDFKTLIWNNCIDFDEWRGCREDVKEWENRNCPHDCGLCQEHRRNTCCTLLEITDRCNMNCSFCFADPKAKKDPDLETVKAWIDDLVKPGETFLQLSGGEPTVREDLPEIIAYAKEKGCKFIQLNTNGIRLAEDKAYAGKLKEAGLSFVFLQFDGLKESTYRKLRGRELLAVKKQAIENCGRQGIGVTLVPVLVPGVNISEIGDIIRFAVKNSPNVRGVHFQPVSFFGRFPKIPGDSDRFTLDELIREIGLQCGDLVDTDRIQPSCCDHPMCGFHGDFVVTKAGGLLPLGLGRREKKEEGNCCGPDPAEKNRNFIGKRWERRMDVRSSSEESCSCDDSKEDFEDMTYFLERIKSHGFTITSMAFQDAGNLDIERLRTCSLHVYRRGKMIPFCAAYLTPMARGNWEEELCRPGGFALTEELLSLVDTGDFRQGKASLADREDLRLLDVGCGRGSTLKWLKTLHPCWELYGIDPEIGSGAYAEDRFENIALSCAYAEQLPYENASMDVVLFECSLSRTQNPEKALQEALRVLKPSGRLLISDMYAKTEAILPAAEHGEGQAEGVMGRLEFSERIRKRVKGSGFTVLEYQDRSSLLSGYVMQQILDGNKAALCAKLGISRDRLKKAGAGYYIMAAEPSCLKELLGYAREKSGFYRDLWGDTDAELDLSKLPTSSAEDIKKKPESFLCVKDRDIARVITLNTSGSTAAPKRLFFTEEDLVRTADFFEKGIQFLVNPGDNVIVFMEGPGRFSVGGLLKEGLARIDVSTSVYGFIRDMKHAAAAAVGFDTAVGVPGQMYTLAKEAPELRFKTVLLSADYVPEAVKACLEKTWNCKVFTHWGMTETGYGGGVQCGAREGYHMRDGDLLLEILDPETGEEVEDGALGELVITTLKRKGMPLVRYRTGDITRKLVKPCPCGCLKPRLDKVRGRVDDSILLSKDLVLSMHVLDELLFGSGLVRDFRATLDKSAGLLTVYVSIADSLRDDAINKIKDRLRMHFGQYLSIRVVEEDVSPYMGSAKRKITEAD